MERIQTIECQNNSIFLLLSNLFEKETESNFSDEFY